MNKKLILFILCLYASKMISSEKLDLKPKNIYSIPTMDRTADKPEFQLSLIEDRLKIPVFKDIENAYFYYVPMIGRYGNPYNTLTRMAIIENNPKSLKEVMPKSLESKINLNNFNNIKFFTLIYGSPVLPKPADRIYDIVFHPTVRTWYKGSKGFNEIDFNIKTPMGLFAADGVIPAGNFVSFEQFKPEDVYVHPADPKQPLTSGLAFSPDNAQFGIVKGRDVASFWISAFSAEKKSIVVAYVVIIDNKAIEDLFYQIINRSKNLKDLTNNMKNIKTANAEDKKALNNAINIIQKTFESEKEEKESREFEPWVKEWVKLIDLPQKYNDLTNKKDLNIKDVREAIEILNTIESTIFSYQPYAKGIPYQEWYWVSHFFAQYGLLSKEDIENKIAENIALLEILGPK